MRFKLFIIIAIILFIIIYLSFNDHHVNSNAHIETSLNLSASDVSEEALVNNSKKNEVVRNIKISPSIATGGNRQLNNKTKNLSESVNNNQAEEIPQDLLMNMTKLFESAKSKNWNEFYSALDFLDLLDQESLNLALFQASLNNAPINILQDLLSRGALFSPEIINLLAMQNKLTLIKKLIPLGLNLYTTDKDGRSAIYYTLLNFNSKETFDYLISQNVNTQSIQEKLDPLDKALEYTIKNYSGIHYIDALIADGAQIQKSHKQYLEQIKLNNYPAYINIISKYKAFEDE